MTVSDPTEETLSREQIKTTEAPEGVPESVGEYQFDYMFTEEHEWCEEAYYYDNGDGHGISIILYEHAENYELIRRRFGDDISSISISHPIDEFEELGNAFEAAEDYFAGFHPIRSLRWAWEDAVIDVND